MKFLSIFFIVAAIFVAGSNGGSPQEPAVCDSVLEVIKQFTEFTSTLLRMFILNSPRSDDESKSKEEMMEKLCGQVENHEEVPNQDKENMRKVCPKSDDVNERAMFDNLSRATIWDCFVEIFQIGLMG